LFASLDAVRAQLALPFERRWLQFAIHGFDLKKHHWLLHGPDLQAGADLPSGRQLRALASSRLHGLLTYESVTYPDEMWKWAAEGTKATQLFFTLKIDGEPTRDKGKAFENFTTLVAAFGGKHFAETVWQNYKAGRKPDDADYRASCKSFLQQLWGVVQTNL
jgi:hypothetical protein